VQKFLIKISDKTDGAYDQIVQKTANFLQHKLIDDWQKPILTARKDSAEYGNKYMETFNCSDDQGMIYDAFQKG